MGLDALKEVYNPLAKEETAPPHQTALDGSKTEPQALSHWQESAPVVALSDYLKANKQHGITLQQLPDGQPVLVFAPGLKRSDAERWAAATTAAQLFLAAADDLKELLNNGLLFLQPRRKE